MFLWRYRVGLPALKGNNRRLTLSIIIVNYNVKYFLEQCLYSLRKARVGIEAEIIVVDNHSTDGSLPYLKAGGDEVHFIENNSNVGFARACNQGLAVARGQYILFLNPDTLLPEDSLHQCLAFFEQHKEAGALGVRMIDGSGRFLKESKRSFPAPLTSLFKLFGLARLFPKSKWFNRYHLGHLNEEENHEVDVLAGAFMLCKKEVLKKTGSFDEAFFMYGEDIDLSYRIQQAGYKNYYLAHPVIIHFKGESTKRGSLNYVRMFYQAMSLFVKKHYGGARADFFLLSIQFAIRIRALVSALGKFIAWIGVPFIDAVLILFSFLLMKEVWEQYVKPGTIYSQPLLAIAIPVYTLMYLIVGYYAGLYNRKYRTTDLLRSTLVATLVLLAAYALLPEHLRFSRGILLFGSLLAFGLLTVARWLLKKTGMIRTAFVYNGKPYLLVIGNGAEFEEVKTLLHRNHLHEKIIGRVAVNGEKEKGVATLDNLKEAADALNAQELIFCAGHLSYKTIIKKIGDLKSRRRIRFHAAGSQSIVGSDSSGTSGEVIAAETSFRLGHPSARRLKRLLDVFFSLLFLFTFPVHWLLLKSPLRFFSNCFSVLGAKKTWIGYAASSTGLPPLRKGVLASNGLPVSTSSLPSESLHLIDYWYAKEYELWQEVQLIIKNYRRLDS